ncbi:MAG: Crp/Fnr family transcriptional regulator [Chloroflexi bacterium]|nr:Crp/Fnr family transcriptional regulator [Chloroflexota bacterium]
MTAIDDAATLQREALRACTLFAKMSEPMLDELATSMRPRRYRSNETIFHMDDPGDSLHVVLIGAVKIVLPSAEGEDPAILATLGPGDFFGGLALLDGAPRSATAVAMGATQTLVLRRERFLELVDEDADLRLALLAALAAEIRSATDHVHDLQFLDLPARLARRLLRHAESLRPDADGSVRLPWPYTQSELAGMIGSSRQSVNRLLGDFASRGLIRQEREAILLLDRRRLETVAER